jgi:putative chitinase
MTITPAALARFAPHCGAQTCAPALSAAADEFGIVRPVEIAHWLAQLCVESAGLTRLEENLSYTAGRLMMVWPRRFPTAADAAPYAQNPRMLADKIYGGRMGNTEPGAGWRYRGRGYIMTTGHDNYADTGKGIGLDLLRDPDQLSHPAIAARAAGWFWKSSGLNALAEAGDIVGITRVVNGGLTGLAERQDAFIRARDIFTNAGLAAA